MKKTALLFIFMFSFLFHRNTAAQEYYPGDDTTKTIYIPVVFHVVYKHDFEREIITKEYLNEIVELINKNFNDVDISKIEPIYRNNVASCNIRFYIPHNIYNENGNRQSGISYHHNNNIFHLPRGNSTLKNLYTYDEVLKKNGYIDSNRFLNIWICNLSDDILLNEIKDSIRAYTTFPQETNPYNDGIVIDNEIFIKKDTIRTYFKKVHPQFSANMITHEIGHWLGLFHIWGKRNGCLSDDKVSDTPNQSKNNITDFWGIKRDSMLKVCGKPWQISNYQNFMDYTFHRYSMFTHGQKKRMRWHIYAYRPELLGEGFQKEAIIKINDPNNLYNYKIGQTYGNWEIAANSNMSIPLPYGRYTFKAYDPTSHDTIATTRFNLSKLNPEVVLDVNRDGCIKWRYGNESADRRMDWYRDPSCYNTHANVEVNNKAKIIIESEYDSPVRYVISGLDNFRLDETISHSKRIHIVPKDRYSIEFYDPANSYFSTTSGFFYLKPHAPYATEKDTVVYIKIHKSGCAYWRYGDEKKERPFFKYYHNEYCSTFLNKEYKKGKIYVINFSGPSYVIKAMKLDGDMENPYDDFSLNNGENSLIYGHYIFKAYNEYDVIASLNFYLIPDNPDVVFEIHEDGCIYWHYTDDKRLNKFYYYGELRKCQYTDPGTAKYFPSASRSSHQINSNKLSSQSEGVTGSHEANRPEGSTVRPFFEEKKPLRSPEFRHKNNTDTRMRREGIRYSATDRFGNSRNQPTRRTPIRPAVRRLNPLRNTTPSTHRQTQIRTGNGGTPARTHRLPVRSTTRPSRSGQRTRTTPTRNLRRSPLSENHSVRRSPVYRSERTSRTRSVRNQPPRTYPARQRATYPSRTQTRSSRSISPGQNTSRTLHSTQHTRLVHYPETRNTSSRDKTKKRKPARRLGGLPVR